MTASRVRVVSSGLLHSVTASRVRVVSSGLLQSWQSVEVQVVLHCLRPGHHSCPSEGPIKNYARTLLILRHSRNFLGAVGKSLWNLVVKFEWVSRWCMLTGSVWWNGNDVSSTSRSMASHCYVTTDDEACSRLDTADDQLPIRSNVKNHCTLVTVVSLLMSLSYQCEIDGLVMLTLSGVVVTRDICYRPSVRLSVCLSHGWIIKKRLKLGLWNFHHAVAPSFSFLRASFIPEILRGSPRAGALNEGGVGKIGDFRTLSRHISEMVQDRTKVAIDH